MRRFVSTIAIAAIMISVAVPAALAATAARTWVKSNGLSANAAGTPPCGPTNPCDTFATALGVTAAGGEINCVDNSTYGPVTITKSVTIDCGGQLGGIDPTGQVGSDAIQINGAGIVVKLRNLTINGNGITADGVRVENAATVIIENCVIQNFGPPNSAGINVLTGSSSLQLYVSDTLIANIIGIGLNVYPGGPVGFVLDRVRLESNGGGIVADGHPSHGMINGFVRDSVITGNGTGIYVSADFGGAPTAISVSRSHVTGSGTGLWSVSRAATVLLSNSTIQGNGTALSSFDGGAIFSYGNNDINDNGASGTAPTVISQH